MARQKEIPGVFDNVKTFPDLERAMKGLLDLREEFGELGTSISKKRTQIQTIMKSHDVTSYVACGLKVEIKPGEEQLQISKIKPPKETKPKK